MQIKRPHGCSAVVAAFDINEFEQFCHGVIWIDEGAIDNSRSDSTRPRPQAWLLKQSGGQ